MKNMLLKNLGYILFISLFLLSPNLYAYCFNYEGLRQQAGLEIRYESIETEETASITDSFAGDSITITASQKTDSGGSSGGLAYNLKYCHLEGFTVDVGASYLLGDGTQSTDDLDVTRTGIEVKAFLGYEW